jgi:cytochrome c biogenesis protein CcmG, thiol:disulfide interchange protein DsbE
VDTKALGDRVVVVKFFAEYCQPCKKTLPAAERVHRAHPEAAFIGVSEDEYNSQARKLVESYGLTFPVVHDEGNGLAGRFRVSDLPVTFVTDSSGTVRWVGGPDQGEGDLAVVVDRLSR